MTEPGSTGIGGDMFCLYYNSKTKKVHALNGSGRYPGAATLEQVRKDLKIGPGEQGSIPMLSALASTTPGAAAGWIDTVEKFGSGKLSLEQILQPAIEMGEEGFPVSELSSHGVSNHSFMMPTELCSPLNSGRKARTISGMLRQTSEKCSRKTPRPKTGCEVRCLARL
jgi:gamma-glutamyltranspeptidase